MPRSVHARLAPSPPPGPADSCLAASREGWTGGTLVAPLAKGLAVLAAFDSQRIWLRNHDIVRATGLPAATVSRLLHSLAALGYLRLDATRRRFRLAAASLTLGYAAIDDAAVQSATRGEMQKLADAHEACLVLGTRDRLDVVVLEARAAHAVPFDLRLRPGMRQSIGASAMGWALLTAVPEAERSYLQENMERRSACHWPALRRAMAEGVSQVSTTGFCVARGEWCPDLVSVAVPVRTPDRQPLALACVGHAAQVGRARITNEIGPRLVNAALALQERLGMCA
ncbi:IclR family transcriptional regulator [Cupriavidus necator]|uniref:IclR family transcriptional regulator n=1 Tax=Cupriavidus necator TaxID=106590 RepID=UPI002787F132|nr:IclR family transcriptional regulator [Cupriavidus necator]MDQ0141308.1 DNA-binding IclR family transcriptional regulator [Cupriavidus necator]